MLILEATKDKEASVLPLQLADDVIRKDESHIVACWIRNPGEASLREMSAVVIWPEIWNKLMLNYFACIK